MFSYEKDYFFYKLGIIFLYVMVSFFGIINIYSSSIDFDGVNLSYCYKQFTFFIVGCVIIFYIYSNGLNFLYKNSYLFLLVNIFLLILAKFIGTGRGTSRWLDLGIVKLQPSEIAKITLILSLSRYFHKIDEKIINWKIWIPAFILTFIMFLLISLQPDLGTALIVFFSMSIIIIFAGIPARFFVISGILFCAVIPFLWNLLHDYQKQRILTLFFETDLQGAGYQIFQSKIAIGSGGLLGKGFLHGTQSSLNFLPEKRTDFIFAMMSEEWGFVFSSILIISYAFIIFSGFLIGMNKYNLFHKLVILSCSSLFFFHVFINIGMVIGILPVVGVPLPLMSYGGSSFLTFSICTGLIISKNNMRQQ